jgi:hypothetical protein
MGILKTSAIQSKLRPSWPIRPATAWQVGSPCTTHSLLGWPPPSPPPPLDAWATVGVALWAHVPLVEEEEAGTFHLAAEGHHGRSPGQTVKSATTGAVTADEAGVEAENLYFYSAIFQGRHYASDPVDSSTPFSPDPTTFPQFSRRPVL